MAKSEAGNCLFFCAFNVQLKVYKIYKKKMKFSVILLMLFIHLKVYNKIKNLKIKEG